MRPPAALPLDVTVVVTVRNERRHVPGLVEAVRRQTVRPTELIVVDGGSTDGTLELLHEAAIDGLVRVVEAPGTTIGGGRNRGTAAATTEWIAYTDAGIEFDEHWLERLVRVAEAQPTADVIYGSYEPITSTPFERAAALAYVEPRSDAGKGPVRTRSIACCLARKKVWEAVGGFPEDPAPEDRIFMRAIDEAGVEVAFAPEATVRWHLQPGFASTFRRFRLYSRYNVLAGEQASWHYGVARLYAPVVGAAALAAIVDPAWLVVPALAAQARVAKSIWARRDGKRLAWAMRPLQFALVEAVILTVDAATFVGWYDGAREKRRLRVRAA